MSIAVTSPPAPAARIATSPVPGRDVEHALARLGREPVDELVLHGGERAAIRS